MRFLGMNRRARLELPDAIALEEHQRRSAVKRFNSYGDKIAAGGQMYGGRGADSCCAHQIKVQRCRCGVLKQHKRKCNSCGQ